MPSASSGTPATAGFFTWPAEEPHLIGGKCKSCGRYFFPKTYPLHKVGCRNQEIEEVMLARKGKLRSYTWQYYPPPPPFKAPEPFVAFGIGQVELPEGISVVGILTGCSLKDLALDMDVELTIETLYTEAGVDYLTWKFRPISK